MKGKRAACPLEQAALTLRLHKTRERRRCNRRALPEGKSNAPSSNGKRADSDSVNQGSNPCGASSHTVFGSKRTKTRMALLAYGGGLRNVLSEADHMKIGMESLLAARMSPATSVSAKHSDGHPTPVLFRWTMPPIILV